MLRVNEIRRQQTPQLIIGSITELPTRPVAVLRHYTAAVKASTDPIQSRPIAFIKLTAGTRTADSVI